MPSDDRRWVVVLRNPKAGGRSSQDRVDRLADSLRREGLTPEIHTDLSAAVERTEELQQAGKLRVLVGVGGDGTAAELVNRTCPGTPLTLLPAGNGNLLARSLKIPGDPEQLSRTIVAGRIGCWDAGRANGRIFLLMASCGLDADIVRVLHDRRSGHMTSRHYLKPLWNALRCYQYPELRVSWDENAGDGTDGDSPIFGGQDTKSSGGAEGDSPIFSAKKTRQSPDVVLRWVAVFNLSCYGWLMQFAPQADGRDAELDLCGFRRGSRLRGFGYLAAMYLRQHTRLRDWFTRRIRRVRITADVPVAYQLDGDPGGLLPLEVEILPRRLTMLAPEGKNAGCGMRSAE
jgi:diacylglycerol kinase (ATP)